METLVTGTPRLAPLKAGRHSPRLLGSDGIAWVVSFTLKRVE